MVTVSDFPGSITSVLAKPTNTFADFSIPPWVCGGVTYSCTTSRPGTDPVLVTLTLTTIFVPASRAAGITDPPSSSQSKVV